MKKIKESQPMSLVLYTLALFSMILTLHATITDNERVFKASFCVQSINGFIITIRNFK